MEKFLDGKLALVTGGTRGIGKEIARKLLEAGAAVAINGRTEAAVARALQDLSATGGKVAGKAADVRSCDEVSGLFHFVDTALGGLDILVNNAGVGVFGPLAELTVADWQRVIDTNLSGVFYCSREALFRFRNRGGGYLINISSLAGRNAFAGGGRL